MITRRGVLAVPLLVQRAARDAPAGLGSAAEVARALAELEHRHGGRLGVAILGAGTRIMHRGDERFALCSTFEALLAAFVLWRAEHGREGLEDRIVYGRDALLSYAPMASRHVGPPGATVAALCEAIVTLSDNMAANLLLARSGGPAALTAWLRDTGDAATRLDHDEPALNDVPAGEVHDTTTPVAMAETLRRLLFGTVLAEASRTRLLGWMLACRTGDRRLRAGVPTGWRIADKTGTFRTTCNDVAALMPPQGAPRLVAAYVVGGSGTDADREAVLAAVGRLAARV